MEPGAINARKTASSANAFLGAAKKKGGDDLKSLLTRAETDPTVVKALEASPHKAALFHMVCYSALQSSPAGRGHFLRLLGLLPDCPALAKFLAAVEYFKDECRWNLQLEPLLQCAANHSTVADRWPFLFSMLWLLFSDNEDHDRVDNFMRKASGTFLRALPPAE